MARTESQHVSTVAGRDPAGAVEAPRAGVGRDETQARRGSLAAVIDAGVSVEPGEIFVVMGLSGSGKSTPEHPIGRPYEPPAGRMPIEDRDVLLVDEAFSALDPLVRRETQDELVDGHSDLGNTIVFVTDDLDEALRIGDRIALVKDGQIVQIGAPEEILSGPADHDVARSVMRWLRSLR